MKGLGSSTVRGWIALGPRFLPFADAASDTLPLSQLLRLSLFQISVGMAMVLLTGTLNRVMIIELGVPASLVALMVALPLVFAPARALIGFRSDTHRSLLGWRRVPYVWMGTLLQFGGLAIMPFALLVLSGDTFHEQPAWLGQGAAALAFLLVGAGLHTAQTAGLALATDLSPKEARPRVVALLYVMLLVGMVGSAVVLGSLLEAFTQKRLIQVIQGAALLTMVLNVVALWQQEPRRPTTREAFNAPRELFGVAWREFMASSRSLRFLVAVGLGTAAFSMQDVLLEPYGAEVLGLSVSATTMLTALFAGGTLVAFAIAANRLHAGADPHRLAATGAVVGIVGFSLVVFAAPMLAPTLFRIGTALIGLGGGLFCVGTLTIAMELGGDDRNGLALGAWGAVQATAIGVGVAAGGLIRDGVGGLAESGALGTVLANNVTGYGAVYHLEIFLLFATLVAIGPLVRRADVRVPTPSARFGLAEFPG